MSILTWDELTMNRRLTVAGLICILIVASLLILSSINRSTVVLHCELLLSITNDSQTAALSYPAEPVFFVLGFTGKTPPKNMSGLIRLRSRGGMLYEHSFSEQDAKPCNWIDDKGYSGFIVNASFGELFKPPTNGVAFLELQSTNLQGSTLWQAYTTVQ